MHESRGPFNGKVTFSNSGPSAVSSPLEHAAVASITVTSNDAQVGMERPGQFTQAEYFAGKLPLEELRLFSARLTRPCRLGKLTGHSRGAPFEWIRVFPSHQGHASSGTADGPFLADPDCDGDPG